MEVGSIIAGKYRIERPIGAGGMGTVVAARHLHLGTPVALKFLNDMARASRSSVERFTREARTCAKLRSEHVCRVSDYGLDGGVPYIVLELLDGTDLARLLDGGPLPQATVADYVLQACAGLAEAHAHGIIHRDLKPGNLFLTKAADGTPLVKVLDFGIAKIPVGEEHALTRTATVVGSPGYMAPEQLRSSRTVDQRADIWALGVILYELVSGRHPFRAEAVTEIALKIGMDEPPALPEASPELQAVVMRCLAKRPEDRYEDVSALATDLAPLTARGTERATMVRRLRAETISQPPAETNPEPSEPETVREGPTARTEQAAPLRPNPRAEPTTHDAGVGVRVQAARRTPARRRRYIVLAGLGVIAAAMVGVVAQQNGESRDPVATPPGDALAPSDAVPLAPSDAVPLAPTDVAVIAKPDLVDAPAREVPAEPPVATVDRAADRSIRSPIRTGSEIDAITVETAAIRKKMSSAGLVMSDLGDASKDDVELKAAVAAKNLDRARSVLEHWRAAVDATKVDRAFVTRKLDGVNQRASVTKLAADRQAKADQLLGQILRHYNNGEFERANKLINDLVALIDKPAAPKPGPSPDTSREASITRLLAIINGPTSAGVISGHCVGLAALAPTRVPWERCITAQCSIEPRRVDMLISLSPVGMRRQLRELCQFK